MMKTGCYTHEKRVSTLSVFHSKKKEDVINIETDFFSFASKIKNKEELKEYLKDIGSERDKEIVIENWENRELSGNKIVDYSKR